MYICVSRHCADQRNISALKMKTIFKEMSGAQAKEITVNKDQFVECELIKFSFYYVNESIC